MVPASLSHIRCHRGAEESDRPGSIATVSLLRIQHRGVARAASSDEIADHGHQRHAECRETRHQHSGTRSQGEYRHPVERLVNEARHDPLILSQ
jgi:hypothetical protein